MGFSSQKLAVLLVVAFFTVYIRFYALGNLLVLATTPTFFAPNDESLESNVALDDQASSHTTETPIKLLFLFLRLNASETAQAGARNMNIPSTSTASNSHTAKTNNDDFVNLDAVDTEIDAFRNVSASAHPAPFLYGVRPFQIYGQYMNDCGAAWWLWLTYFLSKMIASVDKKRMKAKVLREKLIVLVPNFLLVAWIFAHLLCLILRPLWTIFALVPPLGGIGLLWKDMSRIGRKLSFLSTQEYLSPFQFNGFLNGCLVGLFIMLLPSALFRAIAVLYVYLLGGQYPRLRKLIRSHLKKPMAKLLVYTNQQKNGSSLKLTKPYRNKKAKVTSAIQLENPRKIM